MKCAKRVFEAEHVAIYVTNGNADSKLYMEACTDRIVMPSKEDIGMDGFTLDLEKLGRKASPPPPRMLCHPRTLSFRGARRGSSGMRWCGGSFAWRSTSI